MALTTEATTVWTGGLFEGSGNVALDSSGLTTFEVNWDARAVGVANTTNPEELLAAAHSSCFSMALSNGLAKADTPAETLETTADVTFQPGEGITGIHLTVKGTVPGITEAQFEAIAEDAKANCPISQALSIPITIEAELA